MCSCVHVVCTCIKKRRVGRPTRLAWLESRVPPPTLQTRDRAATGAVRAVVSGVTDRTRRWSRCGVIASGPAARCAAAGGCRSAAPRRPRTTRPATLRAPRCAARFQTQIVIDQPTLVDAQIAARAIRTAELHVRPGARSILARFDTRNPADAVPSLYGRNYSVVFSLTSHAHHSAADC